MPDFPSMAEAQVDPQSMPEIRREFTMIPGATESLARRVHELTTKFDPYYRQEDVDKAPLAGEPPPIRTAFGGGLRNPYVDLSGLENHVAYVLYKLEL